MQAQGALSARSALPGVGSVWRAKSCQQHGVKSCQQPEACEACSGATAKQVA